MPFIFNYVLFGVGLLLFATIALVAIQFLYLLFIEFVYQPAKSTIKKLVNKLRN